MNTFKTLCLSLKKDTERRTHMLSIKDKLNIEFDFFDAIEPNEITDDIENELFSHTDFYDWNINQKAVMATFMSHLSMLRYSCTGQQNLLVIEDDIDYVGNLDFNNINFKEFDLYNVGTPFGCYSYFVSYEGACKILTELKTKEITQAYDWELSKINNIRKKISNAPQFTQIENKFISNISPNGYTRN